MSSLRTFYVMALGRSGTAFLAHLLSKDTRACVHHEPDPFDPKLLALRYAGQHDNVLDAILTQRFERLMPGDDGRFAIYGEVNSYLRYEVDWLKSHQDPVLIHLVRDGRDFVRSAYPRPVYTPQENTTPIVPKDSDPFAAAWGGMSRFEKLCWYWQHTNEFLAQRIEGSVRFERLLEDYGYLKEKVLAPTGIDVSEAAWEKEVARPRNTSREFLRRAPSRPDATPTFPHWHEWTGEQQRQFMAMCGPTMQKLGYPTTETT